MDDETLTKLRCSAVVLRGDAVLLRRHPTGEWVLPGGTPRHGESSACVLREVRKETDLLVDPQRVAFMLEAANLDRDQGLIEIVFHAPPADPSIEPVVMEAGPDPRFVPIGELAALNLRPPIAGRLRALHAAPLMRAGVYLGNVWRLEATPTPDSTPEGCPLRVGR